MDAPKPAAGIVTVPAVEAPVQQVLIPSVPIIELVPEPPATVIKQVTAEVPVPAPVEAPAIVTEKSEEQWKDVHSVASSDRVSDSKKKRMNKKKAKAAVVAPAGIPSTTHESEFIETVEKVNQSYEGAYYSADSEAPGKHKEKGDAGKIRKVKRPQQHDNHHPRQKGAVRASN